MDPFKEEKFLPNEDGLGKLSNTANLIAIFERSLVKDILTKGMVFA